MPADIGAYKAKTHLPALLERVARGERFTITKHGCPIARLVPIERTGPDRRREAIERLKLFREAQTLDVPVKELIGEGRRD
jgi:prevent-host-death family protein